MTKTPRQAYFLGSVWLPLGLAYLVLVLLGDDLLSWRVTYPVAFVVLGLGYLLSGGKQAQRAREQGGADRQISPADRRSTP